MNSKPFYGKEVEMASGGLVAIRDTGSEGPMREVSVVERLDRMKVDTEQRLADIDSLRELFEKNPDLKMALELIAQLGMRY